MDLGAAALDESRSLVLKHLDALEGIVAELVAKANSRSTTWLAWRRERDPLNRRRFNMTAL